MRPLFKFFALILILTGLTSCQSKPNETQTVSQFFTDSIYSNYLSEFRKHNVYLPKNFDKNINYPIIYETDGSDISKNSPQQRDLDSLINNNIIKPTIVVISHNNKKIADSTSVTTGNGKIVKLMYRNFEYVNDYASTTKDTLLKERFKNHMLYFKDELIPKFEEKFNQNIEKNERYFFGVSNGAGFGMSLLNKHPNVIGTYLCFSTFGGDIKTNKWNPKVDYPKLYLKYGSKEPLFLKEDAEFLKQKTDSINLKINIEEFDGGHDFIKWKENYIKTLSKLLKPKA